MSEKVPTYLTTKEVLAHLRIGRDALRSLQADAEQYHVEGYHTRTRLRPAKPCFHKTQPLGAEHQPQALSNLFAVP